MFRDYYYFYEFGGPQTVHVFQYWCEAGLEGDWNDIRNQIHRASQNYSRSREDILVFKYEADAIKALGTDYIEWNEETA